MGEMRDMFFCALVYLFLFTVQSSQELKARIKPNKTDFFFESGIKLTENVTCESDCGIFNWSCTYMWLKYTTKFGKEHGDTYIKENKSIIGTPPTENVTIRCLVTFNKEYSYSEEINLFIIEKISATTTPFFDDKNASNSRKIITEVSRYAPRNITIRFTSDIDNLKEDPGNIEISCNADCKPECDRYLIYYDGLILNTSKDTRITKSRRNSGRYQCAASNAVSNSYLNSTNSVDIDIKYVPSNVRIQYWSDYGGLREGPGYIYINCSADCNPECDKYLIYHNGNVISQSEEIKITKNHSYSGRYHCAASNSLIQRYEYSTDDVFIDIQYAPRNVSIKYSSDNGDMQEGNGYINITCNADCNPECDRYLISYNGDSVFKEYRRKETRIKKDRINSGLYRCKAINSLSNSVSDAVNISIHYGPINASVLRKNQIISVDIIEKEDNYTTISLKCSSSCYPLCEVAWYKDGQLQHRNSPVIEIKRGRRMSGVYHCEASGVEGNVESDPVHVIIQYPPGSVTITPNNDTFYTKIHGKPLHNITCEADCLPKCTYTWLRQYNSHPYTTGNSLFATESYDSLQPSKRFLCRASNTHNYKDSRWITIETKNGPDNVIVKPSLPAIENSTFTLTCVASCYHGCQSYSWYHKRRPMNQSASILKIHYMSKGDSGEYQCKVTDYFGEKSGYYTVYVQYGPKSVTIQYSTYYPSLDKYLIEGKDHIKITCKADCYPECTYLFYKNEKLLNNINKWVHRNMSGRYTCAAKNSMVKTYMNSSNFEDIYIKYKPNINSDVDQTTITAPDLLDLTFCVDSFPPSNVTIFHENKRLTFIPHVTGQLSFNVSIKSCLEQGRYRVEAVNEAGSDNFTFVADVKCSPIIVRYSNLSKKGYQVGDSLNYMVAYKAEPNAEVSWSFVHWNKKEFKGNTEPKIQNKKEYTMIEISALNFSNFGKYKLELKNELGSITQEFHIQGPPQRPTDLNVDCPHSAIISWRPGFDGGTTQNFIIEYSDNSSFWQTHRSESVVPIDENFMSAQINDIQPNIPYSFRIWANNSFGVAESDTTVNCTRQNIDKMASSIDNPNALVGIGILVLLLLIATAVLIAVLKLKRKRGSNNQDNSLRKQGNESHEEDNASEIVENILYITADDAKEQIQAPEVKTENPQNGSDVYAVVEKKPKPDDGDDQPVYTDVCKADQKKKKPAIAAKPSKVKKDERPTVNKDGLIYVDLDLKDTPSTSKGAFVIHGADDRTQYVDIDFTRRADPPPDTDNEQSQNEKEKEKA